MARLFNITGCSKFIYKHLVKFSTTTTNRNCILFKRTTANHNFRWRENILSLLTYPNTNTDTEVVENTDLPRFNFSMNFGIHGHSHGIVCLSDLNLKGEILLGNPVTKEFRQLPRSVILLNEPSEDPCDTRAVGFGYDHKSKDFKVVRIVNLYHQRVEVYNLSTDRWREIQTPVLGCVFSNSSCEMYHNGVYYWLAYNDKDDTRFILSFDMSKEVFHPIPLPNSSGLCGDHKSMGLRNGSVVLFHYSWTTDEKETKIDIWALEKDEDSCGISFSKQLTIGPITGLVKPLLFVNSDELVIEKDEAEVISYNVSTKEVKNLPMKGEYHWMIEGFVFEKSLLSVKGGTRLDLEEAVSEIPLNSYNLSYRYYID